MRTTQIDDGSTEVRLECSWVPKVAEPARHANERLVGDVLCEMRIARESPSEELCPSDGPAVQRLQSVLAHEAELPHVAHHPTRRTRDHRRFAVVRGFRHVDRGGSQPRFQSLIAVHSVWPRGTAAVPSVATFFTIFVALPVFGLI